MASDIAPELETLTFLGVPHAREQSPGGERSATTVPTTNPISPPTGQARAARFGASLERSQPRLARRVLSAHCSEELAQLPPGTASSTRATSPVYFNRKAEKLALFRFGLVASLVIEALPRGELTRRAEEIAASQYDFPDS